MRKLQIVPDHSSSSMATENRQTRRGIVGISMAALILMGVMLSGCHAGTDQPGAAPDPKATPTHDKPASDTGAASKKNGD